MNQQRVFDVTIIGGGPVGMFTAFYAGLRQLSVHIIDSLSTLGGQLSALYPEKYIYDIAGFPKIKAQELIQNLQAQMDVFNPTVSTNESVEEVTKLNNNIFKLSTNQGNYLSKTIIITAGNGAFTPRKLNLQAAKKYEGTHVHYSIQNLRRFEGKSVVVLGGGDSAVDWALMLQSVAKEVTLIHRRETFRAHEQSVSQLLNSNIKVLTPYIPVDVIGNDSVQQIIIENVKEFERKALPIDDIIVNYGTISNLGPMKEWGLTLYKNKIIVDHNMQTSIPRIYAAGDICTYKGKAKLIVSGFGEVPIAVSHAKNDIDPTTRVYAPHSTLIMEKRNKLLSKA